MIEDTITVDGVVYKKIGYENITNEVLISLNSFLYNNSISYYSDHEIFLNYYISDDVPKSKNIVINYFSELKQPKVKLIIGYMLDDEKETKLTIDISNELLKESEEKILDYLKKECNKFIARFEFEKTIRAEKIKTIQDYIDGVCKKCNCTREQLK